MAVLVNWVDLTCAVPPTDLRVTVLPLLTIFDLTGQSPFLNEADGAVSSSTHVFGDF